MIKSYMCVNSDFGNLNLRPTRDRLTCGFCFKLRHGATGKKVKLNTNQLQLALFSDNRPML